ncbi:CHAT domain-containing protein [Nonomuraea jabiensis]|uniref:CHAT domain-containing protein n=1 Tax=Nonomuraea jabiensis TaxID=882448 RepID=UPI00369207FC
MGEGRLGKVLFSTAPWRSRFLQQRRTAAAPPPPPEELPPGVGLEPFAVEPEEPAPEGVAQLRVVRKRLGGEVVFGVSGSCCCSRLPFHAPPEHGRPGLALATLMARDAKAGGVAPAETLHAMRAWSESKGPLVRWLNQLRGHHPDLHLVIWDDTDFDIPWELLWLRPSPADGVAGGWLGAEVSVSRRTTLDSEYARPMDDLRCEGEIVGYVDEADAHIAADLRLLQEFGLRRFPTLRGLLGYLEQAGLPLAMVYVACHGEYATEGFRYRLGGVPLGELSGHILARLTDAGGLVFLNACHSGRLIIEERFNDHTLRGFVKVFLASGAAGLIGTTGAVGTHTAKEVARSILEHLRRDPDTPVPQALRDYRRALVPAGLPPIDDIEANRRLLRTLYTFMYVYYGSPHTTVAFEAGAP